ERERQTRNRPDLAVAGIADDSCVGLTLDPARRNIARSEAIRAERAAIVRRSEDMHALPQLENGEDAPGWVVVDGAVAVACCGVEPEPNIAHSQSVASELDPVDVYVLIDVVHANGAADRFGLPAYERKANLDGIEQRLGEHMRVRDGRPRP